MFYVWALPASIAVMAIFGVSAAANWSFGWSQGTLEPFTFLGWAMNSSELYAYASLAVDALKFTLLFGVSCGLASRTKFGFIAAVGCASIWVACLSWSVVSAMGFVALNHAKVTDLRGKQADAWVDAKSTMERLQTQRGLIPMHRQLAIVDMDLSIKKKDGLYEASTKCTDARNGREIKFCNQMNALLAEQASAQSADDLDKQIEKMRSERDHRVAVSAPDPLSALLAKVTSTSSGDVSTFRSLSFALLLELVTALGLWSIWNTKPKRKAKEAHTEPQSVPVAISAHDAEQPPAALLAQEKKPSPTVQKLKADALAKGANLASLDPIDAAIEAVEARRGESFGLNEVFGELAIVHAARSLPQPTQDDRKAIGIRLSNRDYEADREKRYRRKRGRNVPKVSIAA